MNKIEQITKSQIRTDIPEFRVGDKIKFLEIPEP